uniref:Plasma membrane calcium transporting P-type ATPase C-terminal domain-containing protein n=1 Tax=Panagrolaimus sp. JU765 TaxID=591449 RepID=A0AC34QK18_9BILA
MQTNEIRVVKAFQAGLDRREPSLSGPSAQRLREISRQLKLQVEQEGKGFNRSRSHSRQNEAVSSFKVEKLLLTVEMLFNIFFLHQNTALNSIRKT